MLTEKNEYNIGISLIQRWTYNHDIKNIKIILIIHFNVFIYGMAYWVQYPLLPWITTELGADARVFGYFETFRSLFILIGGPIIGKLTDTNGGKISLILCQIGCAISYFTLASSNTLQFFFISRIFTALHQIMQTSQACISNLVDTNNREEAIGRLSVAYGIGMIFGSIFCGYIKNIYGLGTNAYFASLLSLSAVIINAFFLPKLTVENNDEIDKDNICNNLTKIYKLGMREGIRAILLFLCVAGMGLYVKKSMFLLIEKDIFEFTPKLIAYSIAYAASISTINNAFFLGYLRKKLDDDRIVKICLIVNAIYMGILGLLIEWRFINIWLLCLVSTPYFIATGLIYVMLYGRITKMVNRNEVGTALALSHSTRALLSVIGPSIGGQLVYFAGYSSIGYFGFVSYSIAFLMYQTLAH